MRSDGTALGSEFRVNDYVSSNQQDPSVAALEDGGFIVTWYDDSGHDGGSSSDVWAQHFDASGSAVGDDFLELIRRLRQVISTPLMLWV